MSGYASRIAQPPKTLTEREQNRLLKVSGQHAKGFRDHVIFSIALGTGMRAHEILGLNVGDIYWDGKSKRRIKLRVFKRSTADLEQEALLPETVRAKLNSFYTWKSKRGQSLEDTAPLFQSRNRNRLSTRQLRTLFRNWQKKAGFERFVNFHVLRHTACTNLYRKTQDIRLTQRFARHKSILSTVIYTHPTDEDLVRSIQDLPC